MFGPQILSYETLALAITAVESSDWLRSSSESLSYVLEADCSLQPSGQAQHESPRLPKVWF